LKRERDRVNDVNEDETKNRLQEAVGILGFNYRREFDPSTLQSNRGQPESVLGGNNSHRGVLDEVFHKSRHTDRGHYSGSRKTGAENRWSGLRYNLGGEGEKNKEEE